MATGIAECARAYYIIIHNTRVGTSDTSCVHGNIVRSTGIYRADQNVFFFSEIRDHGNGLGFRTRPLCGYETRIEDETSLYQVPKSSRVLSTYLRRVVGEPSLAREIGGSVLYCVPTSSTGQKKKKRISESIKVSCPSSDRRLL